MYKGWHMELADLKPDDFIFESEEFTDRYSCECSFQIWDSQWDIYICIEIDKGDTVVLEKIPYYIEACKNHIQWVGENKDKFIQAMIDGGIVRYADYCASTNPIERDGKVYYRLFDGAITAEIEGPITEEVFIKCLTGAGINLYIDDMDNEVEYLYEMFFGADPPLFGDHGFEVSLRVDKAYNYKILMRKF